MRGGGHGHADAIVAKPHADVAHDDGRPVGAVHGALGNRRQRGARGILLEVQGLSAHHQVAHAQSLANDGHVSTGQVVDGVRVIAKLLEELLLALDRLAVGCLVLLVTEGAPGAVVHGCHGESSLTHI